MTTPIRGITEMEEGQDLPSLVVNEGFRTLEAQLVSYQLAASDLTTVLTTGTTKAYFRAPFAFTMTAVRASLNVAAATGTVTVDINKNGTTMLSTKLTIDATEKTSATAATPAVISVSAVAADDLVELDLDAVGDTSAGLIVTLIGELA